ncbi:MAG: hypothetical protein PVG49_09320 [Desulfobacteraceae bacterium]|jgi:hypothetical protein
MAKYLDEHISLAGLCVRIHCDQDEALKAVEDMIGSEILISDEKGESWLTRRDGFKIVAALHLKKVARFTPKQVKTALVDLDLSMDNQMPIVKLLDDDFLSIKLRLRDLRARYIDLLEQ